MQLSKKKDDSKNQNHNNTQKNLFSVAHVLIIQECNEHAGKMSTRNENFIPYLPDGGELLGPLKVPIGGTFPEPLGPELGVEGLVEGGKAGAG